MTPQRIQRKRTRGWRMPVNAIYVGRGTEWGNPYTVEVHGREEAINLYRQRLEKLRQEEPVKYDVLLEPLQGKDLACWCAHDQACHADVLLELVQREEVTTDGNNGSSTSLQ